MHMASIISKVPGNDNFQKPIEFSDPFLIFWNRTAFNCTQCLFFLTAICLNVAAIVDTAEVVDSFFGLHYKSWGYAVSKNEILEWKHAACNRHEVKLDKCAPFADETEYGKYLLSLGYIVTAVILLPVCLMDLKENSLWQVVGFGILVSCSVIFCWDFTTFDMSLSNVSIWGTSYREMVGVILFNFALVLAIPAWVHEKKEGVRVQKVVFDSTVIATSLYVLVGALGAASLSNVNVNMLSPMVSGAYGTGIQWAASVFAFFIIGLDIPLFCVLTRYNLTHSGLCSESLANLLVVWIPWLTSWIYYQGDAIKELLDWGGVLMTSAIAFILPFILALRVLMNYQECKGFIRVYIRDYSRRQQIYILVLIIAACVIAVIIAIVGQLENQEQFAEHMESPEYLNATIQNSTASARHHHHKHHHHHMHRGHLGHEE